MEGEGAFLIEQEDEPVGNMLHPLLMEEILEIVFRHLFGSPKDVLGDEDTHSATESRKDIRSCRLVCKMWQNCATSIYRDVAPHLEFAILRSMDDMIDMQKFLETMKDSSMIPKANYKIWLQDQIGDLWSGQRLLSEFLLVCGMEVVKLDLEITLDSFLESFGRITHWNMPSLKHLKINLTERNCDIIPNHLHWIKQLLVSAAKLHHFDFSLDVWVVGFSEEHEKYESELMLQTLQVLPRTVNSLNLSLSTLRDSHLQQLTERSLHLDELILFPRDYIYCSNETISKFFSRQSDTLKTFKLRGCGPDLISEEFPTLKELHHLDIEGEFTCEPISFRDTFPKVSMVRFDFVYESDQLRKSSILCLNEAPWVRSLRFDFPASEYSSEDKLTRNVAGCFTNLRVLNLDMSLVKSSNIAHLLRQVFVLFSDIEEFAVQLPQFYEHELSRINVSADSLFSGIPDADCKQLLESTNYDNLSLETVRRYPSFLNMPKLKKLAVVVFIGRYELTFSDFAVHLAFLKMNALEELRIAKLKVSGSSLGLLKNKLKLLKAEVMHVDNNEPIFDATALSRIFLKEDRCF